MVRTQIQLTEPQARRVRALAREEGISMAAVIRRFIDMSLADTVPDRGELYERALDIIGRFEDREAAVDLSDQHDAYFAGSLE